MTVYLSPQSFAYQQLAQKELDVQPDASAPIGTAEAMLVNPSFFPRSTEADWLEQIARAPNNTRVSLVVPDQYIGSEYFRTLDPGDQAYVQAAYTPWSTIKRVGGGTDKNFDGAIFGGGGFERQPLEALTFGPSLLDMVEHSKTHFASTTFSCSLASIAFRHFYNARVGEHTRKLFGVYAQKLSANPRFSFSQLLCAELSKVWALGTPASRFLFIDPNTADAETEIILSSPKTGASLLVTANGEQIYLLDHPESAGCLLEAYNYCLAQCPPDRSRRPTPPVNYNIPTSGQTAEAPWLPIGQIITNAWSERLAQARATKLEA